MRMLPAAAAGWREGAGAAGRQRGRSTLNAACRCVWMGMGEAAPSTSSKYPNVKSTLVSSPVFASVK